MINTTRAFVLKPLLNLQSLPRHIALLISFLLVIACAYTLAQLTWLLIPGEQNPVTAIVTSGKSSSSAPPRNRIGLLTSAHLFGSAETNSIDSSKIATETRLNLVLRGVVATDPPQFSIAIIGNGKNGKEEVYGIGDMLPGNAHLREVHAEHVILERNGQLEILRLARDEELDLPETRGSTTTDTSPATTLGQIRKTILRNPTAFGDYAVPVVVKENGKQVGYRLLPQTHGKKLFSQIGLQANDVIVAINGIRLDNPQNGISALRKLSTAQNVNITVKRNGNEVPLNIQLQ